MGLKFNLTGQLMLTDKVPLANIINGTAITNPTQSVVDQDTISILIEDDDDYSIYDNLNQSIGVGEIIEVDHPSFIRFIKLKTNKEVDITLYQADSSEGAVTFQVKDIFQMFGGAYGKVKIEGTEASTYIRLLVVGSDS